MYYFFNSLLGGQIHCRGHLKPRERAHGVNERPGQEEEKVEEEKEKDTEHEL